MNHCVPEWEPAGRELDFILDSEEYAYESKSKVWDLGGPKRSDIAYVPDDGFEELCWEDGQLFVVMQALGNKRAKSISVDSNANERPSNNEDVNPSCVSCESISLEPQASNNFTQDDEPLTWLQHPSDEISDAKFSEVPYVRTPLKRSNSASMHESSQGNFIPNPLSLWDATPKDIAWNLQHDVTLTRTHQPKTVEHPCFQSGKDAILASNSEEASNHSTRSTGYEAIQRCALERESIRHTNVCGENNVILETHALEGSHFSTRGHCIQGTSLEEEIMHEHAATDIMLGLYTSNQVPLQQQDWGSHLVDVQSHMHPFSQAGYEEKFIRSKGMNFANFSRPALATIRADLHTVSQASGLRVVDPLQQLDRICTDASASDLSKSKIERGCPGIPIKEADASSEAPSARHDVKSSMLSSKHNDHNDFDASSDTIIKVDLSTPCQSYNDRLVTCVSSESPIISHVRKENTEVLECKYNKAKQLKHQKSSLKARKHLKKQAALTPQTGKRNRTDESHNLSERKRRSRINEKMKALQELIPNVNKTDKASMLEDAITYLKALQQKIQVMALRFGMKGHAGASSYPIQIANGMQYVQGTPVQRSHKGEGVGVNMGLDMLNMMSIVASPLTHPARLPSLQGMIIPPVRGSSFRSTMTHPVTPYAGALRQEVTLPPYHMVMPIQPMILPRATPAKHATALCTQCSQFGRDLELQAFATNV